MPTTCYVLVHVLYDGGLTRTGVSAKNEHRIISRHKSFQFLQYLFLLLGQFYNVFHLRNMISITLLCMNNTILQS